MAESKLDTQVRREQIAEAAMSLVASQGVRRLSIAAIARRVGLVPSGIYRHFKNKGEVLDAVLDLVEKRLHANVEAARAEATGPLECLHGMLVRHVQFIREGRAVPRIIFSDEAFSDRPDARPASAKSSPPTWPKSRRPSAKASSRAASARTPRRRRWR